MAMKIILSLLYLIYPVMGFIKKDYCDFRCPEYCANMRINIVCFRNHKCNYDDACINPVEISLSTEQEELVLDLHNNFRNDIGRNHIKYMPNAKNMQKLLWDNDLAHTTKCFITMCQLEDHACLRTDYFHCVTQNLGLIRFSLNTTIEYCIREIFRQWSNEQINVVNTKSMVYPLPLKNWNITANRFTQLVWASTTNVGCAVAVYSINEERTFVLACNYGPNGNQDGYSIYDKGTPCSKCLPEQTCDPRYKGLCSDDLTYTIETKGFGVSQGNFICKKLWLHIIFNLVMKYICTNQI